MALSLIPPEAERFRIRSSHSTIRPASAKVLRCPTSKGDIFCCLKKEPIKFPPILRHRLIRRAKRRKIFPLTAVGSPKNWIYETCIQKSFFDYLGWVWIGPAE